MSYGWAMDEMTKTRLGELADAINIALDQPMVEDRKGLESIEDARSREKGFDHVKLNLAGCRWDLFRTPSRRTPSRLPYVDTK